MHKFQKIRRNKLIKRFAFLFMALNLAIIAVTGFSYFYMSSMFERVVTEYNVSTVENVHATLATNFSAGEKWAQEIYHNAEIESLSQKNNLKYPSGYLAASKLIDLIEYELGSSSALKEAYIYLSCSDTVISEQGMFDARFFMKPMLHIMDCPLTSGSAGFWNSASLFIRLLLSLTRPMTQT